MPRVATSASGASQVLGRNLPGGYALAAAAGAGMTPGLFVAIPTSLVQNTGASFRPPSTFA